MNRIIVLLGSFLLVAILFSCSSKTIPVEKPTSQEVPIRETEVTGKEPWQVKWEKTLQESRKEGKVVIFAATGQGPAIMEAGQLFKQKYGLALEVITGRGGELSRKLFTERANGLFTVDIINIGMNTNVGEAKPAGALDPLEPALILPEVTDPKGWFGKELPWGDKDIMVFRFLAYPSSPIGINTELVKPEEIKSYYDLLAPKWKGKITMNDPILAGTGFNGFSSLIYSKALDLDFFRQLVLQQPVVLQEQRLQIDWIAKGKYSIALWPHPFSLSDYKGAGAPVDFTPTPKEGTYITAGGGVLSLVNRAPHPNAARVFINWLLSREGQTHVQNFQQLQSARVDISTEGLDPLMIRKPGEKYFMSANNIEEWLLKEQGRYIEMSRQVFGPLIK